MLKSKQISHLLSQGLTPINGELRSTKNSPLSISLLSFEGLPLNTVTNFELLEEIDKDLSLDKLKIFSLLGLNYVTQQTKIATSPHDPINNWAVLELENNLNLIIQKIDYKENETDVEKLYLIIFYERSFPNPIAKLKLDNLSESIRKGLEGYDRSIISQ